MCLFCYRYPKRLIIFCNVNYMSFFLVVVAFILFYFILKTSSSSLFGYYMKKILSIKFAERFFSFYQFFLFKKIFLCVCVCWSRFTLYYYLLKKLNWNPKSKIVMFVYFCPISFFFSYRWCCLHLYFTVIYNDDDDDDDQNRHSFVPFIFYNSFQSIFIFVFCLFVYLFVCKYDL